MCTNKCLLQTSIKNSKDISKSYPFVANTDEHKGMDI